jgi:hypothetical protein
MKDNLQLGGSIAALILISIVTVKVVKPNRPAYNGGHAQGLVAPVPPPKASGQIVDNIPDDSTNVAPEASETPSERAQRLADEEAARSRRVIRDYWKNHQHYNDCVELLEHSRDVAKNSKDVAERINFRRQAERLEREIEEIRRDAFINGIPRH